MIEIRNLYPPTAITQVDRAPAPASRNEARDVPASKVRPKKVVQQERRSNPDRRERRAKNRLDQRTGADRRRNALDIKV